MKGTGIKFREIAIARDGGSTLFEFEGNIYYLDYRIGSATRGVIFHGSGNDGHNLPVKKDLHDRIAPHFSKVTLKHG